MRADLRQHARRPVLCRFADEDRAKTNAAADGFIQNAKSFYRALA
jgi:hypothetical protein